MTGTTLGFVQDETDLFQFLIGAYARIASAAERPNLRPGEILLEAKPITSLATPGGAEH
jgi:hypothetical protein